MGRGRAQLAYERVLVEQPRRLSVLDGARSTEPITAGAIRISHQLASRTGHYFNPHAQRVIEAKASGRESDRLDTRLSKYGDARRLLGRALSRSEAAIVLAIANYLIENDLYNRSSSGVVGTGGVPRRRAPERDRFRELRENPQDLYRATLRVRGAGVGVDARVIEEIARVVSTGGHAFLQSQLAQPAAGNSGGCQVARTLFC